MGMMQSMCEIYDDRMDKGNPEESRFPQRMAPLNHVVVTAAYEVAIDAGGSFLSARRVPVSDRRIVIPCTDESAIRTGGIAPHPLCDSALYVCSPADGSVSASHDSYVRLLDSWIDSSHGGSKILAAVGKYVHGGTAFSDMSGAGLFDDEGKKQDGRNSMPEFNGVSRDAMKGVIRWVVNGLPMECENCCWKDDSLFESWIGYCSDLEGEMVTDMTTGNLCKSCAKLPRTPINGDANIKLITSNDKTNYTYRGRFSDAGQAISLGTDSVKAIQAMNWLVANVGVSDPSNECTYLCWETRLSRIPMPCGIELDGVECKDEFEYSSELKRAMEGYRNEIPDFDGSMVMLAVLRKGFGKRAANTYYGEYSASDYLKAVSAWDEGFCWMTRDKKGHGFHVESPLLSDVVDFAFGIYNGKGFAVHSGKFKSKKMQELVQCRVQGLPLPGTVVSGLFSKLKGLGEYDGRIAEKLEFIICSALRKRNFEKGEECKMELNGKKDDRSYLFGRLFAILDSLEGSILKDRNKSRNTNAMNRIGAYLLRPLSVSNVILEKIMMLARDVERAKFHHDFETVYALLERIDGLYGDGGDGTANQRLGDQFASGFSCQKMEIRRIIAERTEAKKERERAKEGENQL